MAARYSSFRPRNRKGKFISTIKRNIENVWFSNQSSTASSDESTLKDGRRIVELGVLTRGLGNRKHCVCGPLILQFVSRELDTDWEVFYI